ncbi:MAG: YerC/YecD family TrpR-related protein [Christensenellales bacterium]
MQDHIINDQIADLARAMLELDNMDEAYRFLKISLRFMSCRRSRSGWRSRVFCKKVTYQEIAERTGASTATISRVNRCLTYGAGGYQLILGKTKFGDETSEDNP